MRKIKIKTHFYLKIFLAVFVVACTSDFEEHYNPKRQIDKNIVQILSEDEQCSDFVEMIDKLKLRKTLGEAAIYTCLAPTNEHVRVYLNEIGYNNIDEVPETELRRYVNYHFISGMYYQYDIEKKYKDAKTGLNPTKATYYRTRSEDKLPGKSIRIFTPAFFEVQGDDYRTIYNGEGSGFRTETAQISEDQYDIDASNGVIHVLESPLNVLPRTDEAIQREGQTSVFNKWLDKHVTYTLGEKDEFGWVDTTKYKSYTFGRNLANETVLSTVFVPTDEAIQDYFEPYMADLYHTIDSIPEKIITEIIKSSILADTWFKGDIIRNNPELRTNTYPLTIIDLPSHIVGSILASNSLIYKIDKMIEPPKLHSVEGGVYIKYASYSQWDWMFAHTNLESGLTDGLYYQHSPKTILIQPDQVWGSPLAEDLETEELEKRYEECRTGILNINVLEDGGFRKRFYPTEFGYILYDDEKFYDYTGKSVSLHSEIPTWVRSNGAIFEIDGFLTPMQKTDVSRTVYAIIQNNPDCSLFRTACINAGIVPELNLTGFFTYTVFAPTNTAIQNAGIDVSNMEAADLLAFVKRHIVANRYIFSDGVFSGNVQNKNGEYLTVTGAWDSFSVTGPSGDAVIPETVNVQGSNGVVHKINQVL
ncbi:fasciclin domain-containing protein [Gaoshiqia sp. Z1-71]|uniref:fasciclin domain-containing protein n=1 Tax=Gaoshiqia hydrogeniformans TaxID=3290090 RepID=UPI003BF7BB2D